VSDSARFVVTLEADQHTRETWPQAADGHVFQFKWFDLEPKPKLVGEQARWLELVLELLDKPS